jgi:ABC-type dipeptide/oligopeptide/nickel transport system permease component
MQLLYPAMIVAGVAAIAWGLPAAHRLRRPFDILAAFLVLVGTAVALLGALLAAVPGFFQG